MKVSKKAAVAAALVAAAGVTIPTFADPGSPAGGDGSTQCADGTVTWTPTTVWPPNHKMIPVTITYTAPKDNPDTGDTTTITVDSIYHDQALADGSEELVGSGNPAEGPDWSGAGATATTPEGTPATVTVAVRSERSGTVQAGRTYTINVSCNENIGGTVPNPQDSGMAALTVKVPHDQRKQ